MAASVEKMLFIDLPFEQVYGVIGSALQQIGATISYVDPHSCIFVASRKVSMTSWGETITISPFRTSKGCSLRIKSECSLPTQLIDWGKNNENIKNFSFALSKILNTPIY